MITAESWDQFEQRAKVMADYPRVANFDHHIFLLGVLQPGIIPWSKKDIEINTIYESARGIESALNQAFRNLDLQLIESPRTPSPENECKRYESILAARDNGLLCAGISLHLTFNPLHRREESPRMEKYPQTPFSISALLALDNYQNRTKEFIRLIWQTINSFHYCTKEGSEFDNRFLLEVQGEDAICGGTTLLKKLGLNLEQKPCYIPA